MKVALNNLMKETAVNEVCEKGTIPLLLAVMMKYGIAPLVCLYFAWANFHKDEVSQKQNDRFVVLVEAQTAATVKNTEVQGQLIKVVETNTRKLEEIEKRK